MHHHHHHGSDSEVNQEAKPEVKPEVKPETHINLKVSDGSSEIFFKIKKTTPLRRLMEAFAKRQGKEMDSLTFLYDGIEIQADQTPEDLDMEDNDIIEAHREQIGGENLYFQGGGPRLREVLSRLSLGRQDVSEASGLVNQVVSQLIQAIRSQEGSFGSIERLNTGSYYEHVKISEPNEFDIMLVMPVSRLQLDECDDTGAFYYLTFKRNPKEKHLFKFLDEDGKLSAFKMLQALRDIIKREVKNIKNAEVTVKRKKAGSPAITLQIKNPPAEISVDIILTLEVQQNWPPSTQDGLKIEQWLGRKVRGQFRNKSLYLVAKQNKREKVLRGNTWRISFSHIEKDMLNNHGSSKTCCESDGLKCCRKGCLKLLKYLLEQLKMKYTKQLEKFSSYHVKTAFFHSCVMWPNDTDWHLGDLDYCFQKYLGYFLDCLQKSELPHFFIPQYNLLSLEDKASNDFLSRQINYELNNRFPIFQERY
nr:cyclic GMP AMP synthase 3 [synthetic construct]